MCIVPITVLLIDFRLDFRDLRQEFMESHECDLKHLAEVISNDC